MKEPIQADLGKANVFGFVTGSIRDADGNVVCTVAFADKATAQRVVACVNACEGIPTNELEAGIVDHAMHFAEGEDSLVTWRRRNIRQQSAP